jgi:transposase-like protein
MHMPEMSLFEWQQKYGTLATCQKALAELRWPDGFVCPHCASKKYSFITTRYDFECRTCGRQTSVVSGTIFQSSNVPLPKWFLAIYLCASDKGGISAVRLSKELGVSWITAHRMLRKLRTVMADRDLLYQLSGHIEVDDALVGGKQPGKRGRGAVGKTAIIVAVERRVAQIKTRRAKVAGYMAVGVLSEGVTGETVNAFMDGTVAHGFEQVIRTDAYPALNVIAKKRTHQKKVTPPEEANSWLPLVHIVIGNIKTFLNGTFHGVSSKFLHEYLAEFSYRFNRRRNERQLPMRLLNACKAHAPVSLSALC